MSISKDSHKKNRWFVDNYGTRRGALLTYGYRFLYFFGKYRAYRQINWDSVDRLVFVCKGNICRSAYAEAVAKSLGVESISCGIDTVTGKPANEMALKISAKRGFNLSGHKTTKMQLLPLKKTDLLIAMEPWQAEYLVDNLPMGCKCTLLGLWGVPAIPHVHDPYGSSEIYFDNCFNYIEKTVYEIASKVSDKRH